MKPKLIRFFLMLLLFLSLVNAKVLLESVKWQLPVSQMQIENLAGSVCSNLQFVFQDTTFDDCSENFLNPVEGSPHRSEVKVRCRSKTMVQIEVTPSDSWQLVVLVPETAEEDGIINYSIIAPNESFSELSILTPSRSYLIFSTTLNKDVRPSPWRGQGKVSAWSEALAPENKTYHVEMQFANYTMTKNERVITVTVTWNHTGDLDVCFDFYNRCSKSPGKNMKIWPNMDQKVEITGLQLDDQCEVQVTGMYGTTKLKYRTPGIHGHKDNKSVVIEIPQDVSVEAVEDGDSWKVTVGWAKPKNLPEKYNVTLGANQIKTLIVPGDAVEAIFTDVTGEGLYNLSIDAIKSRTLAHTAKRALFPSRSDKRWAGAVGIAWLAAALCIVTIALCWLMLRKRIYSKQKLEYLESKPLDDVLETLETECNDQWEVKAERLQLHEVIGEGAFGVVRRGSLAPTGKEVAVKMLKDYPSLVEVRAFRLEMELMKSVGAHPHVVSLVGCCSGKRPHIIAEYCARGDLLSFLRKSWDVMVSKRNPKYYNNNVKGDYRNDLFKCKILREHTKFVVNKMYDLQGVRETDLTPVDLLSFCRQIAMGMEFLASNRLVHRDLAARNVLVTRDRTLKISDFGLSRDVYEENQYTQTGNGKMPVKWMALESLTRRIYTSQSDVWSFGVVVWEVVTVGGSPYPDVPASRLPRLLRGGYRMPCPPNCSKQLYEVMLSCWRSRPRERPTFSSLHARLDELLHSACADNYLSLELDDEPPPPAPSRPHRYFNMIIKGKRAWNRETYERPLRAVQGNHNHYTSPPVTLKSLLCAEAALENKQESSTDDDNCELKSTYNRHVISMSL